MLRLYRLGLVLLVGCSPVKDPSNVPDAAIDAMDTRPPMVASSIPADMGNKVSVIEPISVYVDEPLDPASVSATTVKLLYRPVQVPFLPVTITFTPALGAGTSTTMLSVKGTVSYDAAARKISFVPAAPLVYGAVHVLQIDVKDSAALALTASLTFITYVNAPVKQFFYTATGAPSSWIGNPTNMEGRWAKRVGGTAPGVDTIWFTADDPRNQHLDYSHTPDGRLVDERTFTQGTDAQYDTADDVLSSCVAYRYDANRLITERTYPSTNGPDNAPCTMDDVPNFLYQFTYTGSTLTGYVFFTNAGTDNTWRTTDDRCSTYYESEYNPQSLRTREVFKTCGTDAFPRTADDVNSHYFTYEYDADGLLTRQTMYNGAGADTLWFTADDVIVINNPSFPGLIRHQRNADGQITDTITATNPGPDTMWGTADDTGMRTATTYNAARLAEKVVNYTGTGTDAMWGTADDVIGGYIKTTYDVNGNRTDSKTYAAGGDAIWENADDRVILDVDYDLNR